MAKKLNPSLPEFLPVLSELTEAQIDEAFLTFNGIIMKKLEGLMTENLPVEEVVKAMNEDPLIRACKTGAELIQERNLGKREIHG